MKPGKRDIPVKIKISGRQLSELQRHTWHMIEAFGLDSKIDNVKASGQSHFIVGTWIVF